jgi:hypothetical protein
MRIALAAVVAAMFLVNADPAAADEHPSLQFRLEAALLVTPELRVPLLEGLILYRQPQWRVGVFAMANGTTGAAGGFVGPFVAATKWLMIGVGTGGELANGPQTDISGAWHGGAMLHIDHDRIQAHAVLEYGVATGLAHRAEVNVPLTPVFGVGGIVLKEAGAGPRFEIRFPRSEFAIWGAVTYSWLAHSPAGIIGLRLNHH